MNKEPVKGNWINRRNRIHFIRYTTIKCSLYACRSPICIDTCESSDHIVMSIYTGNEAQSNIPFSTNKWLWTPINFINNKVPVNSIAVIVVVPVFVCIFCIRWLLWYRIQHTMTIIYEFNSALYQLQHSYIAAVISKRSKWHIYARATAYIFISARKFNSMENEMDFHFHAF